jgi:hypothetical protein
MSDHRRDLVRVVIRQDLVRVARRTDCEEGVAPSVVRYDRLGRFGQVKVRAAVGGYLYYRGRAPEPRLSWSEAMVRYKLRPFQVAGFATDGQLIEDLRRVALLTGLGPDKLPAVTAYQEHGRWSYMTIYRRFGGEEFSWYRVAEYTKLQPIDRAPRGSVTPDRLLSDYRDLAELQDREPGGLGPTRRQFDAWVSYHASCASWHFGTWGRFVEAAGYRAHASPIGRKVG